MIGEDMAKSKVACFLWSAVYIPCKIIVSLHKLYQIT